TFTLVIEHTPQSTSAAIDIEIVDNLPSETRLKAGSVSSTCPGFSDNTFNGVGGPVFGDPLDFAISALPLSTQSCVIEYTVEVSPAAAIQQFYQNDVDMIWYSHPDTSPERREYDASAFARLYDLDEDTVAKSVTATSVNDTVQGSLDPNDPLPAVTIGEEIEYSVAVGFARGSSKNVIAIDTFDVATSGQTGDLAFLAGSLTSIGGNISAQNNPADPNIPGPGQLSIDYGDVENIENNPNAPITDDDVIRYKLLLRVTNDVANDIGNAISNILTNEVILSFTGLNSILERTDLAQVRLVEPDLQLQKSFGPVVDGVATLSLTLLNNGTSAAFDTVISDQFLTSLWVPGSLVPITVPPGYQITETSDPNEITVSVTIANPLTPPSLDQTLSPGESITAEFSLQLKNTVQPPPTSIDNVAIAEGTSLPGSGTAALAGDPNSIERLYRTDANATLLLPRLSLEKVGVGPQVPAAPGDIVTYTLTPRNIGQSAARNVLITDDPNEPGEFQVGSVQISPGTNPDAGTIIVGNNPGDQFIQVSFTELEPQTASTTPVSITYDVRVPSPYPDASVPELLANRALIDTSELPPKGSDDPQTSDPNDPTIVPVEADPIMVIDKTDGVLFTTPGSTLIYDIQYGNAGNQDATGVTITEEVPQNTTFDSFNSSAGWSCTNGDPAGTLCTLNVGDLKGATSANVRFAVTVASVVPVGVTRIENTVEIRDDGLEFPNTPSVPSVDSDTENTPLLASAELAILKDDGGISVVPGQTYFYRIDYSNPGNQVAANVVLTETVPDYVEFDANESRGFNWSCADGDPAGTLCTLNVGDLPPGSPRFARFGLRVISPAPAGAELIENTVGIDDDGTAVPKTAEDNTPLTAVPDLVITKSSDAGVVRVDKVITYTLNYENRGNQNATGALVRETVPEGSVFLASESLPTVWSCPDGAPAGTVCEFTVGDFDSGDTGTLTFAVRVIEKNSNLKLTNVTEARDDGTNGPDPTPDNNIFTLIDSFIVPTIPAVPQLLLWALAVLLGGWGAHRMRQRER
ncbi:MAG: DUF11 domain-containing protein, partial [Halieaceae bacterium]|nr:DUF11 domain-containing protein [Halieaceae bacterium]